ncbi:uncharacterized protein LOC125948002 [Anopheles darlingi]|uniref:uncharacterized protein LOC125948002 n=1 Tax=Anopheles darlingi TaxID=43151 RepID=UPI00210066F3|nr:uncharacterized protein LOC125948002 [Anopheles darlingi]
MTNESGNQLYRDAIKAIETFLLGMSFRLPEVYSDIERIRAALSENKKLPNSRQLDSGVSKAISSNVEAAVECGKAMRCFDGSKTLENAEKLLQTMLHNCKLVQGCIQTLPSDTMDSSRIEEVGTRLAHVGEGAQLTHVLLVEVTELAMASNAYYLGGRTLIVPSAPKGLADDMTMYCALISSEYSKANEKRPGSKFDLSWPRFELPAIEPNVRSLQL